MTKCTKKDTKIMCAVFSIAFSLLQIESEIDNFSVLWLNIAYFYLHENENRFKCFVWPKNLVI